MREDTTISVRRDQQTVLRRMAKMEGRSVTELVSEMISNRLSRYPATRRAKAIEGVVAL